MVMRPKNWNPHQLDNCTLDTESCLVLIAASGATSPRFLTNGTRTRLEKKAIQMLLS